MTPIVNVLLVDDDEIDVETVQRSFEEHQLTNPITHAKDGRQALEILRGENGAAFPRPYVILLDINMPRMNGLEFLDELRADPQFRDSVVFVLTTSDSERDRQAAYARHVAGYMVKSRVGYGFDAVTEMMQGYWKAVVLPSAPL